VTFACLGSSLIGFPYLNRQILLAFTERGSNQIMLSKPGPVIAKAKEAFIPKSN